jgi:hypothetical protein
VRSDAKAATAGSTQRQARRLVLPLAVFAALIALMVAAVPASAIRTLIFKETFGSAAQPSFGGAQGIAVDQSSGDVLVMDEVTGSVSSGSIKRFNADGTPDAFAALGSNVIDGQGAGDETPQGGLTFSLPAESQIAVDNSGTVTDGNIYVTQAPAFISIFSEEGEYLGQLSESSGGPFNDACGVAVDPSGAVYVGDYSGGIHKFVPAANPPVNADYTTSFGSVTNPCTLAAGAGPSAGFLFATQFNGPVSKIDSSTGAFEYVVAEGENRTVSVDPGSGNVFVANFSIQEFDASGAAGATSVSSFAPRPPNEPHGVAVHGSSGNVYVSRSRSTNLEVFSPAAIVGQWAQDVLFTEAALKARINPEGSATTFHIEYGTTASYGQSTAEKPVGSDNADHTVGVTLGGLQPGTTYHYRFVTTSSVGATEGADRTFTTYEPVVADTSCPNQAFRVGPSATLPNCRAFEMVSPVDKNGGEIDRSITVTTPSPGFFQAAPLGEQLAYTSPSSYGDQVSTQNANQFIATRGAQGWSSHGINPPLTRNTVPFLPLSPWALHRAYMGFSEDLSSGWLLNDNDTPITSDGIVGFGNLYRRDNLNDSFEAMTANPPLPLVYREDGGIADHTLDLEFKGASADSSLSVFISGAVLTPDAPVTQFQQNSMVYATSGGQVHLVSVLPDGTASTEYSAVGTVNSRSGAPEGYSHTVDRAVSEDGSRIFWTSGSEGPSKIYVRENPLQPQSAISGGECTEPTKACTIAVSESVGPGESRFWSASTDGSKALFTTHLNKDSTTPNLEFADLYEFDVETETPSLIAGKVTGVVGASEDLSYVYFTSREALDGGAAGKPNLYLDHEGTIEFIATLAGVDTGELTELGEPAPNPSAARPFGRYSRVTPDGRHLVFMSSESLTGYDNTDAIGANPKSATDANPIGPISINGDADFEVFLYDADAGELTCASCNPSGARPVGRPLVRPFSTEDNSDIDFGIGITGTPSRQFWTAAWIPTWENEFHPSRVLSDDGSRLFFNSFDALVLEDTNGAQDVYQWEEQGTGGCEKAEGCISLISTGQSPQKSEFIDASADGEDVFIRTKSSIDPDDPGLYDLYDARVGGGYPIPTEPPPCVGDACQSVPSAPNDPTPASAGFRGAGSPPARKPRPRCNNRKRNGGKSNASKQKQKKAKRCKRAKRGAGR